MAWDGNGSFSRVHDWTTDAGSAINIEASRMDAEDDNFQAGIEACLAKNGENAATANLPMGGFIHTGVGNANARTTYASAADVMDQDLIYYVDSGAADAYVITPSPAYTAYEEGMRVVFRATNANTGASTMNVNSLGAIAIQNADATALSAGEIVSGGIYELTYDANTTPDRWVLTSPSSLIPATMLPTTVEAIAGLAVTDSNFIVGNGSTWVAESGATARTSLGLGSIATVNSPVPIANGGTGAISESIARSNLGLEIGLDVQAWDLNLDQIAALAVTDSNFIVGNGTAWVAESGATARTSLGLGSIATQSAASVAITGGSITGITDLAVADGGTGSSTAADARTALGLAIGTNVQAWDVNLDQIAALAVTDSNFIVGNGSAWVAESGATARTSLGLGTGDSPQFTAVNIASTDTTITRAAAGQVAVEGKAAFMHNASTATYTSAQVFFSTSAPTTEGNNGDIYFEYTA